MTSKPMLVTVLALLAGGLWGATSAHGEEAPSWIDPEIITMSLGETNEGGWDGATSVRSSDPSVVQIVPVGPGRERWTALRVGLATVTIAFEDGTEVVTSVRVFDDPSLQARELYGYALLLRYEHFEKAAHQCKLAQDLVPKDNPYHQACRRLFQGTATAGDPQTVLLDQGQELAMLLPGVAKVSVGNPRIADAQPLGERSITIIGRNPGETTIYLRYQDSTSLRLLVKVSPKD